MHWINGFSKMRLCVVYEGENRLIVCVPVVIWSVYQNTPTSKRRTFMQTGTILDAV